MNQLNSVLLEGELTAAPVLRYVEPDGLAECTFIVRSERSHLRPGTQDRYTERLTARVVTQSHLAEVCNEYLREGRGVRIVGRIAQDAGGTGSLYVIAEHVEFKPERRAAAPGNVPVAQAVQE